MLSKFSLGSCTRHAGLTADSDQELTWWRSVATELRDVTGGCLCLVPDTIACGVVRNTCMGPVIYKHGQAPPISKRSEGMIWTTTCIPNNDLGKREDTEDPFNALNLPSAYQTGRDKSTIRNFIKYLIYIKQMIASNRNKNLFEWRSPSCGFLRVWNVPCMLCCAVAPSSPLPPLPKSSLPLAVGLCRSIRWG